MPLKNVSPALDAGVGVNMGKFDGPEKIKMSEDTALKVGDTVRLNSRGDLMTVLSLDEGSATCAWFVKGVVRSKSFPAKALKKSDEIPQPITLNFGRKLPGDTSE
jgi:uncharacterized protein YodC (DUF2158 family)